MARPHPWEAIYPPGLAWDVDLPVCTLPALLDDAAAAYGDRPAIAFRGVRMGFAELGARVDRLARGLRAAGVRAGDAVALLLPNSPAHPIAFFAVLRLGARVVHLTPLDPARAVQRKLDDSGARTLITTNLPGVLPQALAVQAGLDRLIVADDAAWGPGGDALPLPSDVLEMGALDGPTDPWPTLDPHDPALLQYTGGTTGQPRAAVLTHANLTSTVSIYDAWNTGVGRAYRDGDRMLCVLPLFHIYALTAILLRSVRNGVEMVLHPRFSLDAVLDAIETGRCTHMNGVPTMWIAMVNAPGIERRDLSSLRVASSGGAALPHDISERFRALTGLRLGGGWGMTETSPAGTNLLPDRDAEPGEIGVPLPGVEMQIVSLDDPHQVLPQGQVGEVRIRGPNVTQGYWNRPTENAQAFVDGWFLTGDVGRMEPDGRFVLVDRKKDMIISGGFNVYPRAIEDAIHEHPDVQEAAVIGVPDPYRGQAAKAFVTLRAGAPDLTLDALRDFLAERLGRHELPSALEIRDTLPHTPVGKLAKRELMAEEKIP
jgi:long-chain acyl-CoA synthetase